MALANPSGVESLTGAVLSRRYMLKREIGRGGMGAVYEAVPSAGGAPVAIKILHSHFLDDEVVLKRFLEEGRTCMRLIHPNILRIHECLAAEDGSPYLVMELLEGVPLSAYTNDGGRIGLSQAITILQGMLAGLGAAHAQGVVHRDLKPGNVFLARGEGGTFSVKLLDFGIAKVMDAAGGMGNKTRTGALLGTPAYMSPEQVKSAKDVDARADLWSTGVMFYEMLTGRVAFPAPTEYARLAAVLSATPELVTSVDPELAPAAAFLERALQKDRDRRFQTAGEMSAALDDFAPEPPTLAPVRLAPPPEPSRRSFVTPRVPVGQMKESWTLSTDIAPPKALMEQNAAGTTQASSGVKVSTSDDKLLAVEVVVSPQTTTLASPDDGRPRPNTHPPPPVAIVSDKTLAEARARAEKPATPKRGVPVWLVVLLVVVALGLGLGAGFVLAHGV